MTKSLNVLELEHSRHFHVSFNRPAYIHLRFTFSPCTSHSLSHKRCVMALWGLIVTFLLYLSLLLVFLLVVPLPK